MAVGDHVIGYFAFCFCPTAAKLMDHFKILVPNVVVDDHSDDVKFVELKIAT